MARITQEGAPLNILARQGRAAARVRQEARRAQLEHVVFAVLIWIVVPLIGASLAVGLVWTAICWLRQH